jgi:hypothetical protein
LGFGFGGGFGGNFGFGSVGTSMGTGMFKGEGHFGGTVTGGINYRTSSGDVDLDSM